MTGPTQWLAERNDLLKRIDQFEAQLNNLDQKFAEDFAPSGVGDVVVDKVRGKLVRVTEAKVEYFNEAKREVYFEVTGRILDERTKPWIVSWVETLQIP